MKAGWEKCQNKLAFQDVKCEFIPVRAPAFGGIYKSCVKSFKFFERRFHQASNKLTFEEFNTLVIRIEGLLNTRPLYPDPSDPSEPAALTPFHFISQRAMRLMPSDAVQPPRTSITRK